MSANAESHERDYIQKRKDYADAGITVLALHDGQYQVAGEFGPGQQAASVLLAGFAVDVSATFAAASSLS